MKTLAKVVLATIVMAFLFSFGYGWRDLQKGKQPSLESLKSKLGGQSKPVSATALFESTFKKIQADYIKPVDPSKLKYSAISGMMASLGDPHTMFLEPVINRDFMLETQGNFVGVGARLESDPLGARVVVVFENSPAANAGVKAGDTITAVDRKPVAGIEVDKIVTKIRGEKGTNVVLTVIRPQVANPVEMTIRRDTIITPSAEGNMIPGTNFGRILVTSFAEPTAEQFDEQLNKLEKQGMQGLVIDLRGNGGGLLETAVSMLSRFVDNKLVVKMRLRGGEERTAPTYPRMVRNFKYPIVVLMNEESASASEIFAGCLRDYGKATLVGEHSYGKASVQDVKQLSDGSSAKYTIAKYFLPVSPDIGRKVDEDGQYLTGGLQPDVKASLDPNIDVIFGDIKTDGQLAKAVEVLKSKR